MQKLKVQLKNKKLLIFIVLLLFTFPSIFALLHSGLSPTHDGEYHIIRFYEFDKAIRDGNWYPRWAMDLNNAYGIPLFDFVYPFPNYAASFFHALGASFIDSFKIGLLIATLLSVFFFYLWARLFFDRLASFTAALVYAYAPYRFVDIYVRGSVGEVWALAWFPAYLWAITLFVQKSAKGRSQPKAEKKIVFFVLASFFFALTIFSHNILAVMFAAFGVIYLIFLLWLYQPNKKIILFSFGAFLLGIGLSAIFWLPALVEKHFVTGLKLYNIKEHFAEIYQLLIPSWGTGFSANEIGNQMSLQIGIVNLVVVIIGFIFLIRFRKKMTKQTLLLSFFLAWFLLIVFLMMRISSPVWDHLPLLPYFQFPWRFLSLLIIVCAFLAGIIIDLIKGRKRKIIMSILLISSAILVTLSYAKPAYYHERDDTYYLSRDNFIHGTNSPGNLFQTIWFKGSLPLQKKRIEVVNGKGSIAIKESKTSNVSFIMTNNSSAKVRANIAYFTGWEVFIDNQKSQLQRTNDGRMSFSVPQGRHSVLLTFNDTIIRTVGVALSSVSVFICFGFIGFRKRIHI